MLFIGSRERKKTVLIRKTYDIDNGGSKKSNQKKSKAQLNN